MQHAILGAGAIGGLVGAALASLGEEVTLVVRPERLPGYPESLWLQRPSGTITAPAKPVATLADRVDVLWIATKAYQLQAALESVQAVPRCIIPLLNGVDHVQALRERFAPDSVAPGTIAVEAEKIAPGRFVQRSPFAQLNLASSGEQLLGAAVTRLRDLGFTCNFIQNEQTLLWTKLCFLGPFALATSASGLDKGGIYADEQWKRKFNACQLETCEVANASGAEVDVSKIQGIFDGAPATMRTSMQKDLAAGRPLELDAIGGPIIRGGNRHAIDVSTTTDLMVAIRKKAGLQR